MTLGQRIQEHRTRLGLSQEGLGEQLGVSRQAVSKWEADASLPDTDKLIALSKLFGLTLDELLQLNTPPQNAGEPPAPLPPVQTVPRRSPVAILLTVLCLLLSVAVVWQGISLSRLRQQVDRLTAVAVPPAQVAHFQWSACRNMSSAGDMEIYLAFQIQVKNLYGKEAEARLLLTDGAGQTYDLAMEKTDRLWFRGGAVVTGDVPVNVSVSLTVDGSEEIFPLTRLESVTATGYTHTPLYDLEITSETFTAWQDEYDQWIAIGK